MRMIDASKHCIPCKKGESALTTGEVTQALASLTGWTLTAEGKAIARRFAFKNYAQALAWVNAVSLLAEEQNHHPDIAFGWGYAEITFTTHAIGGLHRNDMFMAAKVNDLHKTIA